MITPDAGSSHDGVAMGLPRLARGQRVVPARRSRLLTLRATLVDLGRALPDALARGLALFVGAFALISACIWLLRGTPTQNIWWVDLSQLPSWLGGAFELLAAALLIRWALGLTESAVARRATATASFLLAVVACVNVIAYYSAWGAASIAPAMPVPLSAAYALGFVWLSRRVASDPPTAEDRSSMVTVAAAAGLLMIAFPLLQIAFFGTTDYRRPADAAVVLGARVYDDGVLSTALEDRVHTGVALYKAGLVTRLVMSGGVGTNGIDEAAAMKRRAVAMGVPAGAIVMDHRGVDTDSTVANTTATFPQLGAGQVLVVSQFWHLPRIKLAYRSAGWDVATVPATASDPIWQTPYFILREVPAFWQYWARSL